MRPMDRLKSILVLMIIVMIALTVIYRQELGAWMADQLMGGRVHHSCRNC